MNLYNFTYELPIDFEHRVLQLLQQTSGNTRLVKAFKNCVFEYEDIGLAYYAGLRGDNWNKHALDFTFEGSNSDITILHNAQSILKDALAKALKSSVSGLLIKNIFFLINENSLLPETDEDRLNADLVAANNVLSDLVKVSERLSTNVMYNKGTPENSINDYFRDALLLMGYNEVKDQTRHGISQTGKNAGEVDILISKEGREIAIFEGFKLNSVDSSYIDKHISKAIINYNALGTATFLAAYISCSDFMSFWTRYADHIHSYTFPLQVKQAFRITASPNAAVRIANIILSRDGFDFPVYFIAINIG